MINFIKWWVLDVTVLCFIGLIVMIDEGTADIYGLLSVVTYVLASYALFQKK